MSFEPIIKIELSEVLYLKNKKLRSQTIQILINQTILEANGQLEKNLIDSLNSLRSNLMKQLELADLEWDEQDIESDVPEYWKTKETDLIRAGLFKNLCKERLGKILKNSESDKNLKLAIELAFEKYPELLEDYSYLLEEQNC